MKTVGSLLSSAAAEAASAPVHSFIDDGQRRKLLVLRGLHPSDAVRNQYGGSSRGYREDGSKDGQGVSSEEEEDDDDDDRINLSASFVDSGAVGGSAFLQRGPTGKKVGIIKSSKGISASILSGCGGEGGSGGGRRGAVKATSVVKKKKRPSTTQQRKTSSTHASSPAATTVGTASAGKVTQRVVPSICGLW
jgi:hypothetical protein